MGSPEAHPNGLNLKKKTTSLILMLILIISVSLLFPSNSEESDSGEDMMKEKKVVLGSRPPGCMNKCHGCNPCRAALVISSRHRSDMEPSPSQRDREGYYLLSWKCKCGNKLFEP